MEFGWINVFGAIIVILLLIPNIVYAIKNKDEKNICTNRLMNIAEQMDGTPASCLCGFLSLYGNSDLRVCLKWCFIWYAMGRCLSPI